MNARHVMSLVVAVIAVLALAACGGDSKESEAEQAAGPALAKQEAAETREALTAALATYKSGDTQAAEDQVAEAYLQHFEEVEGALEQKDAELKEKLEDAINGDLRSAMKDGKPAAEIESQVNAVVADLQKAEAALQ